MSLLAVADGLSLATTLYLRCTSILFTRHHPIGHLYLNRVFTSFVLYAVSTGINMLVPRPWARHPLRNVLSISMFGLFDLRHWMASTVTVLLNLVSLLCVLDFLYRGQIWHQSHDLVFSRMGHVDESSACIVLRASDEGTVKVILQSPADPSQLFEQVQTVFSATDFTATYAFDGLVPDNLYTYSTNASHTGQFKTLTSNPKKWSLVTSSCIKPFYPYSPLDHGLRVNGLEYLSDYLITHPADMMMFLGDFIYIDLPIPHGWTQQSYDTAYRQVYASPSWTLTLQSLPGSTSTTITRSQMTGQPTPRVCTSQPSVPSAITKASRTRPLPFRRHGLR